MSQAQPAGAAGNRLGWRAVIGEMIDGSARAIARFPVCVGFLLVMTLDANLSIAGITLGGLIEEERTAELLFGVLAALGGSLVMERRNAGRWSRHAVALIAGCLAFACAQWPGAFATYPPALYVALVGFILIAPFIGRGSAAAFWFFGVRMALAGLLALFALLLFAGGVSAILASLTYLFGVQIGEQTYEHIWASVGFLAAPLFGLGQVPADVDAEMAPLDTAHVGHGMRALGDYAAAPLLIVYALILHVYTAKIVLTGAVPEGQVGWMVLAFGMCIFAVLVFVHPVLTVVRAPTRALLRFWPVFLAAPLMLLLYAAALRIGAYGLTPERYLLVCFALAAAMLIALQVPPRLRGDIRFIAIVPVIVLLVSSVGPFGAVAMSVRSQTERFDRLVVDQPISLERQEEAQSILRFLDRRDALAGIAPDDVAIDASDEAGERPMRRIAEAYGIDMEGAVRIDGERFTKRVRTEAVIDTVGFDRMIADASLSQTARSYDLGSAVTIALIDGDVVIAETGGEVVFTIPDGTAAALVMSEEAISGPIVMNSGNRRIAILPRVIRGRATPQPVIASMTGVLLLRSSDWQSQTVGDDVENDNAE